MDRMEENLARVVELTPAAGWRELIASDATGEVVARYSARVERWDDLMATVFRDRAGPFGVAGSSPHGPPPGERPILRVL